MQRAGMAIMAEWLGEGEQAAEAHLSMHALLEWVTEVARLNEPRCPHGAVLHDVEDDEDTTPRCCAEGCGCGQRDTRG